MYCYSDWGTSDSLRSMTANIFRYNGAPIRGKSKLQKSLAFSTAGYYSASLGAAEVIYLRHLLRDMGFEPKLPTPGYEDNTVTACIEWNNNVVGGREQVKHIDIRKHFAHESAQVWHLRVY